MAIDKSYLTTLQEVEKLLLSIQELQRSIQDNEGLSYENMPDLEALSTQIETAQRELKKLKNDFQGVIDGSGLGTKFEPVLEAYKKSVSLTSQLEANNKRIATIQINAATSNRNLTADEQNKISILNEVGKEYQKQVVLNELIYEAAGQTATSMGVINDTCNDINRQSNQYNQIIEDTQDILEEVVIEHKNINKELDKSNREVKSLEKNWVKFKYSLRSSISLFQNVFNTIKDGTEYWREQEGAIAKVSNTLGLSKRELGQYRQFILKTTVDTQALYGISSEGLIKLQQGYDEATDKAIRFNEEQIHAQSQLSVLMGENESIAYTSEVDKFGVGLTDARDLMSDLYKTAKSQGITSTKASKEFVTNLKVAQKYNFKGGLQNLKDMTVYSAKMKVNLESIGNIADKISNPEGAIETAAKLQVLGGSFSSLANPLQMLYESLEDVGGLANRVSGMFDGMGSFNKKIGEVQFGGMDRQKIKAASDALGMSYEEAINAARENVKRNQIEQDVKFNTNLSSEQTDLLKTLAQFNKKTQKFEVQTFNETSGKYESKSIAEILPSDIEKLKGDSEQDIKTIVENTFGINDKFAQLLGVTRASKAIIQERQFGNTARQTLDSTKTLVQNNSETVGILSNTKTVLQAGLQGVLGSLEVIRTIMLATQLFNNRKILGRAISRTSSSFRNGLQTKGYGGKAIYSGKSLLKGVGMSMGLGAAGAGLDMGGDYMKENGHENLGALASIGGKGLQGAALGAMFGPIGAAVGGLAGVIWGMVENVEKVSEGISWIGENVILPAGNAIGSLVKGLINWIPGLIPNIFKLIKNIVTGKKSDVSWSGGVNEDVSPTKVNDGVKGSKHIIANPDDSIMFAKTGGVFDKMFDNIIPKIDMMYDLTNPSSKTNRSNFKELYGGNGTSVSNTKESVLNSTIIGKEIANTTIKAIPIGDTKSYVKNKENISNNNNSNNQNISLQPLEVKISGSLKLDSGNKSVDLISMIKNNPMLIKELSKMITNELSSTLNGGRVYKEGQRNTI